MTADDPAEWGSLRCSGAQYTLFPVLERRRQRRKRTGGKVWLEVQDRIVLGHLVDISESGMRIQHDCPTIIPGSLVHVSYKWGEVTARAVWTRELGGDFETGFATVGSPMPCPNNAG